MLVYEWLLTAMRWSKNRFDGKTAQECLEKGSTHHGWSVLELGEPGPTSYFCENLWSKPEILEQNLVPSKESYFCIWSFWNKDKAFFRKFSKLFHIFSKIGIRLRQVWAGKRNGDSLSLTDTVSEILYFDDQFYRFFRVSVRVIIHHHPVN